MAAQPSPKEFQPYRRIQAENERHLRLMLEQTAKAIEARVKKLPVGVGGEVRGAQLRATLAAIRKLQRAMWTAGVRPTVIRAMEDAEKAAESAIEAMTRVAYASLPDAAAEELVRSLRASAESGLKSDAARKRRELSERVFRLRALHDGKVEDMIRQGLIANLSAKELADSVYKYVSPTTPGGASYAAMRLARTEINNAFHERQLAGAERPGVSAVKWNLSGSHVVPDLCNVYAGHNGDGEWPVGKVPDKPHPQCFCFLTYITLSPADFQSKLADGGFDAEIERRTRENMARLGQKVGDIKPKPEPVNRISPRPLTGQQAHDSVPKGLFKRGTMNPAQRKSMKTYESGWFMVINGFLRRSRWGDPEYVDEERDVNNIDSAMGGSILPRDIQGWRGLFNARTIFGDSMDGDLTGFAWDDLGYGSMTTDEKIVRVFMSGSEDPGAKPVRDSVKMKVFVPVGVRGLETSTHTQGSEANGPQAEITLQRDLQWKVVKDHGIDPEGVRHIEVEVRQRDE